MMMMMMMMTMMIMIMVARRLTINDRAADHTSIAAIGVTGWRRHDSCDADDGSKMNDDGDEVHDELMDS